MTIDRATWRRRMSFVLTALAVVVLFEASARALGPNTNQIPQILDQHRQNLEMVDPDWLFVGDSSLGAAVDPAAFDAATGQTSYNLWQATASMQTVERLLFGFGLAHGEPSAVVIGVTGRMFNEALSSEQLARQQRLEESLPWQRAVHPNRYTRIEAEAAERVALVRYRSGLRRPSDWFRALTIDQSFESDERGHLSFPPELSVLEPRPGHQRSEEEALRDYSPGAAELDALARTVVELDRRGVAVYVVEIPVYEPLYHQLYPRGEADVAAFRSALRDRLAGLPVGLVDMTSFGTDPLLFSDENHLNSEAAEQFSAELARLLPARAST